MDQQPRRGQPYHESFEGFPKLNGICIGTYSQAGPSFTTGAGAGSQAVELVVKLLRPLPGACHRRVPARRHRHRGSPSFQCNVANLWAIGLGQNSEIFHEWSASPNLTLGPCLPGPFLNRFSCSWDRI